MQFLKGNKTGKELIDLLKLDESKLYLFTHQARFGLYDIHARNFASFGDDTTHVVVLGHLLQFLNGDPKVVSLRSHNILHFKIEVTDYELDVMLDFSKNSSVYDIRSNYTVVTEALMRYLLPRIEPETINQFGYEVKFASLTDQTSFVDFLENETFVISEQLDSFDDLRTSVELIDIDPDTVNMSGEINFEKGVYLVEGNSLDLYEGCKDLISFNESYNFFSNDPKSTLITKLCNLYDGSKRGGSSPAMLRTEVNRNPKFLMAYSDRIETFLQSLEPNLIDCSNVTDFERGFDGQFPQISDIDSVNSTLNSFFRDLDLVDLDEKIELFQEIKDLLAEVDLPQMLDLFFGSLDHINSNDDFAYMLNKLYSVISPKDVLFLFDTIEKLDSRIDSDYFSDLLCKFVCGEIESDEFRSDVEYLFSRPEEMSEDAIQS